MILILTWNRILKHLYLFIVGRD